MTTQEIKYDSNFNEIQYKEYYNNILIIERNFNSDGQLDGTYKQYDEHSNLVADGVFVNGYATGFSRMFNIDGKLIREIKLTDSEAEYRKDWYENGKLKFHAIYKNNEPIGVQHWDINGNSQPWGYLGLFDEL